MNRSHIHTIERIVEAACRAETNIFGYGIWTHHIVLVVQYGKLLAEKFGADPEIVEISALLHDYAGIKDIALYKDHHVHGASEAQKVLRSMGYPEEKIVAVKQCILSHRGSVHLRRSTLEEICLTSADAMAHIDQVPSLLQLAFVERGMGVDEGATWVREKLERDWAKMCPEARHSVEKKYEVAIELLEGKLMGLDTSHTQPTRAHKALRLYSRPQGLE